MRRKDVSEPFSAEFADRVIAFSGEAFEKLAVGLETEFGMDMGSRSERAVEIPIFREIDRSAELLRGAVQHPDGGIDIVKHQVQSRAFGHRSLLSWLGRYYERN
jgi:hypothetical protein